MTKSTDTNKRRFTALYLMGQIREAHKLTEEAFNLLDPLLSFTEWPERDAEPVGLHEFAAAVTALEKANDCMEQLRNILKNHELRLSECRTGEEGSSINEKHDATNAGNRNPT
jgi:hypothetical protein